MHYPSFESTEYKLFEKQFKANNEYGLNIDTFGVIADSFGVILWGTSGGGRRRFLMSSKEKVIFETPFWPKNEVEAKELLQLTKLI